MENYYDEKTGYGCFEGIEFEVQYGFFSIHYVIRKGEHNPLKSEELGAWQRRVEKFVEETA